MQCPSCHKAVKDGTSICPNCDAVLDESILGAMPDDNAEGEDTPPPAPAPKKPAGRKSPAAPAAKAEKAEKPAAAAKSGSGAYTNKYSQYWTEDEAPAKKPSGAPAPSASPAPATRAELEEKGESASEVDPLNQLKGVWGGFLGLHFEDKLTAICGVAMVVAMFFPWRTVDDGDSDMGLLTWGLWTALLGILAVAGIWLRKSGKLASIPRNLFPLTAVGAGGLSLIIAVIYSFTAFEKGVRAGKETMIAEPGFGAVLAALCGAGMIVGGMLTLKREK